MIYEYNEAAAKVLKAGRLLLSRGLVARTWGNISARISQNEFLITPSGKAYEDLTVSDLVKVNMDDLSWEGEHKPSSEKGLHAGLYKLRPQVGFIVHTHQSNASAISVLDENFDLVHLAKELDITGRQRLITQDELMTLGAELPCAAYALSSTKPLAKNVARAAEEFSSSRAILMRSHGAVCMGVTMEEAFRISSALEAVAGRIFEKRCMQHLPSPAGSNDDAYKASNIAGGQGILLHVRTPFIMDMSRRGKTVSAYIDDAAQIVGPDIDCTDKDSRSISSALQKRSAVLLRNDGAICKGADMDDARAVASVLEKNCQAAMLALKKGRKPVNKIGAIIERQFYLRSYSKRK